MENPWLTLTAERLPEYLTQVAHEMRLSVEQTLDQGGRPVPFTPLAGRRAGQLPLQGMKHHLVERTEARAAEVVNTHPFARVHQLGRVIQHPGSSKRQAFIGREGKLVVVNYTRPHQIIIPARPFMLFQREDLVRYAKTLGPYVLKVEGVAI